MFRFGVDTFIWSELFSREDLWIVSKAEELGFEVLDIAIADPESFPTRAVKKELDQTGLDPVITTTLPEEGNLISPDISKRERGEELLKMLIDIGNELEAKILGGVNYAAWGYLPGRPRNKDEWKRSVEVMQKVAEYADETGEIDIAVEAINRFETHFLNTAEDAVEYCKDVGAQNVKVHLDTFHMNIEEQDFTEAVKTCGSDYLGYVHTCENNRGIPGTGLVPWREFFQALKEINYDGPLVIESFDPEFEELNSKLAIWRHFAESGEELAVKGLENLKNIEAAIS